MHPVGTYWRRSANYIAVTRRILEWPTGVGWVVVNRETTNELGVQIGQEAIGDINPLVQPRRVEDHAGAHLEFEPVLDRIDLPDLDADLQITRYALVVNDQHTQGGDLQQLEIFRPDFQATLGEDLHAFLADLHREHAAYRE